MGKSPLAATPKAASRADDAGAARGLKRNHGRIGGWNSDKGAPSEILKSAASPPLRSRVSWRRVLTTGEFAFQGCPWPDSAVAHR